MSDKWALDLKTRCGFHSDDRALTNIIVKTLTSVTLMKMTTDHNHGDESASGVGRSIMMMKMMLMINNDNDDDDND